MLLKKVAQILKDHGLKHGVLNAGEQCKIHGDINQITKNGFQALLILIRKWFPY